MSDYLGFYDSARLLLDGKYISLYPLPFVYLISPMAYINPLIGYIILTVISILLFVWMFKRDALLWIFYIPVLQTLMIGQVDIIFLFFYKLENPFTLALMTLKPQLFIIAIPKFIEKIKKDVTFLWKFIGSLLIIYLPFFLIRPMWFIEWLQQVDDGRLSHNNSASFWAFPVLFIWLFIYLMKKDKSGLFFVLNPIIRPYDYVFLVQKSPCLIPLSWITMYIANMIQADWPYSLLGIL